MSFHIMLSQHFTSRPSWHVLVSIRKLSYILQVKDLYFSLGKEVVRQEARTCHLWDLPIQSLTFCLRAIEAVTSLPFSRCSDDDDHFILLSKRNVHGWDRSGDLGSHSPAWSRRAVEAIGCSDEFGSVVFTLSYGLPSNRLYQALTEHFRDEALG